VVDESISGAAVVGGPTQSSCGCADQASLVAGVLGADQIEQMIDAKVAALLADNTASVDSKLADLRGWTRQLLMVELAKKQQAADAQQVADRSADVDKYAELVCTFICLFSRLFLVFVL